VQDVLDKFERKSIIGSVLRLARLDAPGVLHLVMGRGIEDGRWFGAGRIFHRQRSNCWDMQELRWVDILE
jgi:hypothetical protein